MGEPPNFCTSPLLLPEVHRRGRVWCRNSVQLTAGGFIAAAAWFETVFIFLFTVTHAAGFWNIGTLAAMLEALILTAFRYRTYTVKRVSAFHTRKTRLYRN